jgi:hypothetical protein
LGGPADGFFHRMSRSVLTEPRIGIARDRMHGWDGAMKLPRRDFIKTAALASAVAALGTRLTAADAAVPEPPPASGRDLYELRAYRLKAGAAHALLDGFLAQALIPALNARGITAVGAFTEPAEKDGTTVWVLIPHASLDAVVSTTAALALDPAVRAAAADYFADPTRTNPAFERIDSWLLLAFAGMPRLAVPALRRAGAPRVFEMRTYESYSEAKALNKIDMFNDGEIGLMQDLQLSPVFYGQALIGRDLPHLTYMLCSPDRETHARQWQAFLQHPVWVRLKSDPRYQDNVSKVTSRFLVPTAYSQI